MNGNRERVLRKQPLRVLDTSDLAAVAGGIDVDGSGRVIIAPEYKPSESMRLFPDTGETVSGGGPHV